MTVAVDPSVIPLGSKLLILFKDSSHKRYNGIYQARDVGSAIQNNKIDLYFGDFGSNSNKSTEDFGVANAIIYLIK